MSTSDVNSTARELCEAAALDVLGIASSHPQQAEVLIRLFLMKIRHSPMKPAPLLFVKPTGGGKSLARDLHAVMFRGTTLTIAPILALGSDQAEKVRQKAMQTSGDVLSLRIDEVRDDEKVNEIAKLLMELPRNAEKTAMLLSSPQAIASNRHWREMIPKIISNGLLRLARVDEAHLFIHRGLSFRREFALLSKCLFSHLKLASDANATKAPAMLMSAARAIAMFSQLQKLSGLSFYPDRRNVFWPCADDMAKRNKTNAHVARATQSFHKFAKTIEPSLKESRVKCFIGYANTRVLIEGCLEKHGGWLDNNGLKSDAISATGALRKEQKFYHMKLFSKEKSSATIDDETSDEERSFNPQVLLATSGAANAGADNSEACGVRRFQFPPSMEDLIQEMGRAGRRATIDNDWCAVCISLESFLYVLWRTLTNEDMKKEYKESLLLDLHVTASALVIPSRCIHSFIANKASNPFLLERNIFPPPRNDSRSFCLGDCKEIFKPVVRDGVVSVLLDLFVGEHQTPSRACLGSVLVKAIVKHKNANRIAFGVNSNKAPAQILAKKSMLLLLAARALGYAIEKKPSKEDNGKTECNETCGYLAAVKHFDGRTTSDLALHSDAHWECASTKEMRCLVRAVLQHCCLCYCCYKNFIKTLS